MYYIYLFITNYKIVNFADIGLWYDMHLYIL